MKTSARLILAGILGVVLVAPPSYSQNNRDQLINSIATDVIGLRATLKQIQETSDQRNAETTKMMQDILKEVLERFADFRSPFEGSLHLTGSQSCPGVQAALQGVLAAQQREQRRDNAPEQPHHRRLEQGIDAPQATARDIPGFRIVETGVSLLLDVAAGLF